MFPKGFRFSQTSLQDYVDCPRRFQLRYLQSQVWPAVQVEPVLDYERRVLRGSRFHRLVERHQLGLEVDLLTDLVADDLELDRWWRAYLDFDMLHGLQGKRYPELALSGWVAGFPLVALFDLVVVVDSRVFIFDWKTYERVPSRWWFESRLQTRVYRYVMGQQGAYFWGSWFVPEVVTLVYWVLGETVVFDYSPALFEFDRVYLSDLIGDVSSRDVGEVWPLVLDRDVCRFCVYRSLCERGIFADKGGNYVANSEWGVGVFELDGGLEVGF